MNARPAVATEVTLWEHANMANDRIPRTKRVKDAIGPIRGKTRERTCAPDMRTWIFSFLLVQLFPSFPPHPKHLVPAMDDPHGRDPVEIPLGFPRAHPDWPKLRNSGCIWFDLVELKPKVGRFDQTWAIWTELGPDSAKIGHGSTKFGRNRAQFGQARLILMASGQSWPPASGQTCPELTMWPTQASPIPMDLLQPSLSEVVAARRGH